MIYAKENPIGIDLYILRLQRKIEEMGWIDTDVYGRLFINERDGRKVIEAYLGNGEYREVFIDDTKNAVFGFIVEDTRKTYSMIQCNVKLICSCRLDKIFETGEITDEEALLTVLRTFRHNQIIRVAGDIQTGLAKVFSDVNIEKLKYRNMYPYFNFSFTFSLNYKSDVHKILE